MGLYLAVIENNERGTVPIFVTSDTGLIDLLRWVIDRRMRPHITAPKRKTKIQPSRKRVEATQ